ncbi:hypothetical protein HOP52_02400 [Halomonas campisalis]|uniref:Uncharacterized protein n=1 Tax=Billgrantia campisalis TaxID=74661 RepID=A0ABS9P680_9GAMM|nr:hypothetical protein [Halomonas campisalis]MCG6656625.1 hypothetical protein [Halomonas campisalis]MDR5861813.1 hypothetical protein [Halomonas campisalis]
MSRRLGVDGRGALRRHGPLGLAAILLLAWSLLGEATAGLLFLPIWIVTAQLIAAGGFEAARLRRRAWLGQYLRDDSPWHRWLRGGLLMLIRHQLLGACLALLLLVKLRLLAPVYWAPLLVGVVGLVVLRYVLQRRLARHVIAEYLPAVTRRLVVWPAASLLILALVVQALWRPQPYLVGLGWEQALVRHVPSGGDSLLALCERLAEAVTLTQYWAMQNAAEHASLGEGLALLGWVLLLLTQSAFGWAYVRLLVGTDRLADALRPPAGKPPAS